ncbi:MAG: spore coat protein, partial [Christensenellales bacterium]
MQNQPGMSEQDLLNDLLNQEKQIMSSYATYIQEASCPNLRKILINQFNQASQDQYQVFDQMRQKGYYQPK